MGIFFKNLLRFYVSGTKAVDCDCSDRVLHTFHFDRLKRPA